MKMLEILKFVFSSFWIWLGFTIILSLILDCIGKVVSFIVNLLIIDKRKPYTQREYASNYIGENNEQR